MAVALSGASAHAANVYLPNYGETPEGISGYARAPDGSLSPLAGSPFPVSAAVRGIWGLAFTPDGGRAFTGFLFDGGVQGLTVAGDGSIAPAGGIIDTPSITSVAVSPDGRFAYAATRDFASEPPAVGILGYSIGADGSLTPIGGSPFSAGEFGDLMITPDGRFLFADAGGQVKHFAIGADGKLTEAGTPTPVSADGLAVSSDGRFLFVGISVPSDGVASYSIGADGNLTPNGPPALTGDVGLLLFAVGPDDRYVYMPDVNVNGIVTAKVADDGSLTVIGTTAVDDPEAVAVSPDGRFLYYARSGAGLVGVASIGADGLATLLPFTVPWESGERERIVFGSSPVPVASFSQTPATPATESRFDATASVRAARFDWDFGDGTTLVDGGPTPTHTYAAAGVYPVKLTVFDAQGCSGRFIYTGQSTVCPGGAAATVTAAFDTLPALSGLSVTNRRFAAPSARPRRVRRGTAFRYRLSEAASVKFTIHRKASGRRVGGRCRPVTRRNRTRRRCVLYRRAGRIVAAGRQGTNRTRFSGKLRGRRLRPGPYRATAIATDSAGGKSARKTVRFRIVRR
jgi:6-phosphogluconolactonase (cycloisomerase 2 family)